MAVVLALACLVWLPAGGACVFGGVEGWVMREGDEVVVMIVPGRGALLTPCDAAAAPLPSLKTVPRQA
jgi:hypothetical protein